MRLYLDDDSTDALLVSLLAKEGHDVKVPADAGMIGEYDPVHLTHILIKSLALSSNPPWPGTKSAVPTPASFAVRLARTKMQS